MKRYKIEITLSNGDKVEAKSIGENQADALTRLKDSAQFIDFVGDNIIDKVDIAYIEDVEPIDPDNYALQKVSEEEYIVADRKNLVTVTFQKGMYNETSKARDLNTTPITDPMRMATILRGIGDYMAEHHPELL